MDVTGSRSDMLGDIGGKRNDIVVGGAFDLADAFDVELRPSLDGRQVFGGNLTRLTSQNLDAKPDRETCSRPSKSRALPRDCIGES